MLFEIAGGHLRLPCDQDQYWTLILWYCLILHRERKKIQPVKESRANGLFRKEHQRHRKRTRGNSLIVSTILKTMTRTWIPGAEKSLSFANMNVFKWAVLSSASYGINYKTFPFGQEMIYRDSEREKEHICWKTLICQEDWNYMVVLYSGGSILFSILYEIKENEILWCHT